MTTMLDRCTARGPPWSLHIVLLSRTPVRVKGVTACARHCRWWMRTGGSRCLVAIAAQVMEREDDLDKYERWVQCDDEVNGTKHVEVHRVGTHALEWVLQLLEIYNREEFHTPSRSSG